MRLPNLVLYALLGVPFQGTGALKAGDPLAPRPQASAHPLRVEKSSDLNFGVLIAPEGAGSLALPPRGSPRLSGALSLGPGSPAPGTLELEGPPGAPFTLRVAPDPLALAGGRGPLRVVGFEAASPSGVLAFDGAGRALVHVGATLHVPAGTQPGPLPAASVWVTVETAREAPATVTLPIQGRLMARLKATELSGLTFGALLVPREDASIRMEPGGRLVGPGARMAVGKGGTTAARFEVKGEVDAPFTLALPIRAQLFGPGEPLELVDFSTDLPGGHGVLAGGVSRVGVGATLRVPAGQKPGAYRGTFLVSLSYE